MDAHKTTAALRWIPGVRSIRESITNPLRGQRPPPTGIAISLPNAVDRGAGVDFNAYH